MVLAVISLGLVFIQPLWKITLTAPQYKEGISMYIWINKITGDTDHTLQNINILNHYVGMKYIEPESIPELKYFPMVVLAMMVYGLIVVFIDRKWWYLSWSVMLLILGTLGLYDFYLWEYDYGHNLSDTAPIKVPGMVYQPPLIGSKMLLNFKAESYPHWGALGLALALAFGFMSFLLGKVRHSSTTIAVGCLIFLFSSCARSPEPIQYGIDACTFCKMTIIDQRYGCELITDKGKVLKFDAIECLIQHSDPNAHSEYQYLVTDFESPGTLIAADKGHYVKCDELPSPMGMNLSAYSSAESARAMKTRHGGEYYHWKSLLNNFENLAITNTP